MSVGPLRAKIIAAGAPYIQDVVITGLDQKEVGAMVFTTPVIRVLGELDHQSSLAEVLATKKVMDYFQGVLNDLAAHATGSANRISRLLLLSDPPSIDKGEITDKGSINQRAVLKHRDPLVQGLHKDTLQNILKPQ